MKRAIASMKDLGTCIKDDRIYRSGEWSAKSFERANIIFEADEVWAELSNLETEDPNFDLDKLVNKYPNFLSRILIFFRNNIGFGMCSNVCIKTIKSNFSLISFKTNIS